MSTFTGFCIAACMFMIFVGMSSAVVNTLGVFPDSFSVNTGVAQSKFNTGYITVFAYVGAIAGAILLSLVSRTTNVIGIWLFGAVFWSSWLSVNTIFYTGGFLNNPTGIAIVAMLWFGMVVMFLGAIVGLLSGNPQME